MSALDFAARGMARRLDADLSSSEPGKGAAQVAATGGGTVQEHIDGFATRAAIKALEPRTGARVAYNDRVRGGFFVRVFLVGRRHVGGRRQSDRLRRSDG